MDQGSWQQPALLFATIVAITLASFGASDLRHGRKRRGISMIVGGFLVVAIPVGGAFAANAYREWTSWEETVSVQGLQPGGEPEFTVDIRHQAHSNTSFTYFLADAGDPDDVVGVFQAQHPDGEQRTTGPFVHGGWASIWHVYQDGARYDLFDIEDGTFLVATQAASISEDGADAEPVLVPFPSGESPTTLTTDITIYLTDLSTEEWHEFYGPIDGVQIADNTITIPASDGSTVTLTFTNEPEGLGFIVTLND